MQLGEILVESGAISADQLESALEYQKSIGGHIGQILVKLGFIEEERLLSVLSEQMQIPLFDLSDFEPDPELMNKLPRDVILRLGAIPLRKELGSLLVGVSDPTDFSGLDELRLQYGANIETVLVSHSKVRDLLTSYFQKQDGSFESSEPDEPAPRRSTSSRRRGRRALSDLVHELERDQRIREGIPGLSQKSESEAEDQAENVPPERTASPRATLAGLVSALAEKGVVSEDEIAGALERLLREKGILE